MIIQPKNWNEFQHYKDRSPSWIKLHKRILDDYEYHCLPVASRALAPFLWLLASEYEEGKIDAPIEKIAFRVRMPVVDFHSAIQPLINAEFFISYADDIIPLAECYQDACLEKRREEGYKPEKKKSIADSEKPKSAIQKKLEDFALFWDAFAYKQGKGGAEKSWLKIEGYNQDLVQTIISAAKAEAARRPSLLAQNKSPKWAQGWITERRWEDEEPFFPSTCDVLDEVFGHQGA